ncbi:hypothetical protein [Paenibacillus daejeonensis]|uniref:hypothetical protein n=1 Tax=Paenibacillus daejeonensis TaxID=135193 RepID=UPI00037DF788|nr:hypothetical protein [Paenibacillus daejeonensis]
MNRSRYIPFERNRYFYGKLLTVRDFMSEQTYVTDKKRLSNRLLFGSGVIAGLQVVAVDDKSLSIETGAALDQLGREIVVPSPLTLKLSNMEGFKNNDYAKNVYLCIAYDEKGKEPVHTVAGATGRKEEVSEHNRILETFRLFVRETPPAPSSLEYDHLVEDTSIWYDDGQVRILQTVPRYVLPGQVFELKLTVERTLQTSHIEFEYEPIWQGIEAAEELPEGKITFSEPTDGGSSSYVRRFLLRAAAEGESEGLQLEAKSGSVRLVIGDRMIYDLSNIRQSIACSEEPVAERILRAYYSRSLDRAIESPAEPCVYLAKINLLQMGATYVIESVEPLPFQEYVINPTMLYKLLAGSGASEPPASPVARMPELEASREPAPLSVFPDIKEEFARLYPEEQEAPEDTVRTGIVEVSIVPEEKKKWYQRRRKNFFSEEIEHGLGAGVVLMQAGLSDEQEELDIHLPTMWNRSNAVYYGPQEMFAGSEYDGNYPKHALGFVMYPKKGSFRIGVHLQEKTERTKLRIRWWAFKEPTHSAQAREKAEEELRAADQAAAAGGKKG